MNIDSENTNSNRYKNLNDIFKGNNIIEAQQNKIKSLSNFIKKVKIEEDPKYYTSQSKEYSQLLKSTKTKLEAIIKRGMGFVNKSREKNDIKKYILIYIYIKL